MLTKTQKILYFTLIGVSFLFVFLPMLIQSIFFGWVCFVGIGFAIYVLMTSLPLAIKEKDKISLVLMLVSLINLILGVIAIFVYKDCIQAFISTLL